MFRVLTIAELAEDAFVKAEHVRCLESLNVPTDYEERKKAFVALAIAKAAAAEAEKVLLTVVDNRKGDSPNVLALVTLIASLAAGAAIGPALAALSLPAWASILSVLLPAGEDAVKLFLSLHPELQKLENMLIIKAGNPLTKLEANTLAHQATQLTFAEQDDFDRRNVFN